MKKAILFLFLGLTLTHCANQKNNTTKVEEEEWTPMPDSVVERLYAEQKKREQERLDSIDRVLDYQDSIRKVHWSDTAFLAKKARIHEQGSKFTISLFKYFGKHQRYPDEARNAGVTGSIMVGFSINPDSTVNFWISDGRLGYGCEEEAERVLKEAVKANMHKFIPEMFGAQYTFSMFFEPPKTKESQNLNST